MRNQQKIRLFSCPITKSDRSSTENKFQARTCHNDDAWVCVLRVGKGCTIIWQLGAHSDRVHGGLLSHNHFAAIDDIDARGKVAT